MKELRTLELEKKKYLIFDLDGTLIDSIGIYNAADQELIQRYAGKFVPSDIIQEERDLFFKNHESGDTYLNYMEFLINKYNLNMTKEKLLSIRNAISHYDYANVINYKSGVVTVLKKLYNAKYTLVLATITDKSQLYIYVSENKKMQESLNIADTFDLILTKEDVRYKKPNPEIYNKVLEYYNANREDCLIFEDSLAGVMAAKNAGIEVVNVYDKYAIKDRKKIDFLTDYSIANFREFNYYLKRKKY